MKTLLKMIGSLAVRVRGVHLCPGGLFAQGLGSINGTVTDSSGAVVAGAEVTATQAATGISTKTTTGSEGTYRLSHPVRLRFTTSAATRAGFRGIHENGVEVRADAAVTVNITLKPGKAH